MVGGYNCIGAGELVVEVVFAVAIVGVVVAFEVALTGCVAVVEWAEGRLWVGTALGVVVPAVVGCEWALHSDVAGPAQAAVAV